MGANELCTPTPGGHRRSEVRNRASAKSLAVELAGALKGESMVVVAVLAVAAACAFFLYVLVEFSLDEKRERQRREAPLGFPVISSGQIVMPLETPREERRKDCTSQKTND